jgi:hypothetical protein
VEVVFEVRGAGDVTEGAAPEPGGLAFVETRTATRVAPVSAPG